MVQGISFDGLASGLATDEIIKGLMEIERAPIRRLERQNEANQAIRDTWQDVNMQLSSLEQEMTSLRLSHTYESFNATSSEETIATATATSEAEAGNFHLDIESVARAHRIASDTQFDSTSALELEGDIEINGVEISIGEGDSLMDIRDKINAAYGVGVTASIISNTLVLESQRTGIENEIQVVDDNDVLVELGILSGLPLDNLVENLIDHEDYDVEADASSNKDDAGNIIAIDKDEVWTSDGSPPEWVELIFNKDDENWPIFFNRIELFTESEGEEGSITDFDIYAWDYVHEEGNLIASVRDNTEDHVVVDFNTTETEHLRLQIIGTHDDSDATIKEVEIYNRSQGFKNTLVEADDARLTINGVPLQSDSNTIDDAVQGMNFTVNTVGEATITVIQDIEKPMEAVRGFVEQYNSSMDFIAEQLKFDQDTNQAGILQGDSTLMRLQYSIRRELMGSVPLGEAHAYNQLMDIGISIDRHGYMSLDEGKLQSALQQNPDDVQLLFTAEEYGATDDWEGATGVAVRLNEHLQAYLQSGGIIHNRDQMYFNMIRRNEIRMDDLERRMEMKEMSLRRQFVRLEEAMSDFMGQSEWLEGQIANLAGFGGKD